jgi:hypothetical protein
MARRRILRVNKRAAYWAAQMKAASDGEGAMLEALRWLRSEIVQVKDSRPGDADQIARDVAQSIAKIAKQVPTYQPTRPAVQKRRSGGHDEPLVRAGTSRLPAPKSH